MRLDVLIKWAAIGWTLAIFVGCGWPSDYPTEDIITVNDKFIHFSIFGLWAFLWLMVYRFPARLFVIGVLYGFAIEIYQLVMPINRDFEWLDLVADTGGILAGLTVGTILMRRLSRG
ncbi:VanZ family protein [Larkinella sp. VNQ87]|uniref:VanZ family protein n=1 Tax=Larkinella sp. VNQ87 TaxID=3400921 RepID=UPI003C118192